MKQQYRYVCPHCLRTFLDTKYSEEEFCWQCGQGLAVVPKMSQEKDDSSLRQNLHLENLSKI